MAFMTDGPKIEEWFVEYSFICQMMNLGSFSRKASLTDLIVAEHDKMPSVFPFLRLKVVRIDLVEICSFQSPYLLSVFLTSN